MVQFERWQRIVQEVKVYSCNEKEAIVCEEVIWTPGPWRLVPPTWIGKDWMRMSKESAQVWFQELNKCTSWRWVDKKKSVELCVDVWRFHWLAIMLLCVCYDLTCRGFKHFSTPGHSLSFLVKSCKGVISIYIYICMYVNILGLFSRWMWYKKHRACSKDSFFNFPAVPSRLCDLIDDCKVSGAGWWK